ncbi:alpha/beta hydrolase [Pseudohoeflea coraliihabitans]|uniref:palmitoyl-protein hydrolase n=1 Tax=Pseudohoeflea coraliihabitans TaxID=2860393 RepID=A0ABS6WNZ7_9HYPH|nr:alpha/beta hydrolase [Pseudohoeflea sp. DP4N28-3]MBW3097688.1 alpha/beta hydrolase [Pseudohoeflea sp. DP4N28-3]
MEQLQEETVTVGDGARAREIAVLRRRGEDPAQAGTVWLGGYRSDMTGSKAEAICDHQAACGGACLRFDYSGHGASGGAFTDGTISRWLEEALVVFERFSAGPQILVGSSMGSWIALRMVQELTRRGEAERIAGLLLIAPAPDFTMELMEPELTDQQKDALAEHGRFEEPTPYGPDPNIYTRALFEDGRKNRVLDGILDIKAPVRILQGMDDPDVPWRHALKLVEHLPSSRVELTLIRDGDHRLSRPSDIAAILGAIEQLKAAGATADGATV